MTPALSREENHILKAEFDQAAARFHFALQVIEMISFLVVFMRIEVTR